jgi:hypothetical protein
MRPGPRQPRKRPIGLEVRVFYSAGELARAGNVPLTACSGSSAATASHFCAQAGCTS